MTTDQEWAEDKLRFALSPATDDEGRVAAIGPLTGEFIQLAAALASESTVRGVLRRVVEGAQKAVPGADLVSVTLRSPAGYTTPVETDVLATQLDELQYQLDEGPCVEATRTAGLGLSFSPNLDEYPAFARWGKAAAALGVNSVLAVGMFPHGGNAPRMGALNIYSFEVDGIDEVDRDIALVLAAHASTALAATTACTAADLEVAQLRRALSTRDIIGQAKGILMERRRITADEAFDVLRAASQSLNVKLHQVAATIAERRAEL